MAAALLLLAFVWLLYRAHAFMEEAERRSIELATPQEVWEELVAAQQRVEALERQIEVVNRQLEADLGRARMH
jgi:predicted nucleic acid-binding protein